MYESESTARISDEKKEHKESNYIIMRACFEKDFVFRNESG